MIEDGCMDGWFTLAIVIFCQEFIEVTLSRRDVEFLDLSSGHTNYYDAWTHLTLDSRFCELCERRSFLGSARRKKKCRLSPVKFARNTAYLCKNNPLYISTYQITSTDADVQIYRNFRPIGPESQTTKSVTIWATQIFSIQKQQRLHNGQVILENPVMTDCDFAGFKMQLAEKQNLICHRAHRTSTLCTGVFTIVWLIWAHPWYFNLFFCCCWVLPISCFSFFFHIF